MTRVYWNFKIRIESKKTPFTKEIVSELSKLFEQSEMISDYEIEEDSFHSDPIVFQKKESGKQR